MGSRPMVAPVRLLPLLLVLLTALTRAASVALAVDRSSPPHLSSSSSPALEDVIPIIEKGDGCDADDAGSHHRRQCERPTSSPFRIIVDGGSTGSRLHVFEFVQRPSPRPDAQTETVVVRRGSAKAWTPLSAYAPSPLDDDDDDAERPPPLDPKHVASHLLPAFEYAASVVPERYHRLTTVRYQATAGMRLLSESDQDLVYDALYGGLMASTLEFEAADEEETGGEEEERRRRRRGVVVVPFPFALGRDDVSTLDGRMEGLYGAVAANYLAGRIDADLHLLMPPRKLQQQRQRHSSSSRGMDGGGPIHEPAQECPNLDADGALDRDGHDGHHHEDHGHHHHHHHHGPYGALDMGGSSTQLVFHPGDEAGGANASSSGSSGQEGECDRAMDEEGEAQAGGGSPPPPRTCRARYADEEGVGADGSSPPLPRLESERPAITMTKEETSARRNHQKKRKLDGNEFFSTSYLSYGVDQFRERLWDLWIADAGDGRDQRQGDGDETGGASERGDPRRLVNNPCGFPGHEVAWRNATLVGTGDASACADEVRRLLPGHHHHHDRHRHRRGSDGDGGVVGGVRHPPLRGKFYAMSLYFFTLDCLRVLSHPDDPAARAELDSAWPTPTLRQLGDALDGFCSRSWHDDLSRLLEEGDEEFHPFTRPSVLPHRCAEAVYMVTLLRDGFGFDPDSRDITFAYDVDGSEVEWTLGMALSNRAEEMAMAMAGTEAFDGDGGGGGGGAKGEEAPRMRREMGLFSWMEYLFSSTPSMDPSSSSTSSSATPVPRGCGGNGTSDEDDSRGGTRGGGGEGGGGVGLASAYFLDMFGYYSMDRRLETFRPEPGM